MDATAHISIQGWAELDAAWRKAPGIVREELSRAMYEADMLLYREVSELTPVGVGGAGGLKGTLFSGEEVLADNVIGVVGSPSLYAVPVELGTKPHPVSKLGVQAIEDWVRHKLGITDKEATRVANAVAWKIQHYGTPAVGMFHRAFSANRGQVAMIFGGANKRIAERLAGA